MHEPARFTVGPVDRPLLEALGERALRERLAAEIPALRAPHGELVERFRDDNLLHPLDALYRVAAGGDRWLAAAWAPDRPAARTTLRVALAPLGDDASREPDALRALVDALLRTTAIVRVERWVGAGDGARQAAALAAGLRLEATRRLAEIRDGRPADVAVYVRFRNELATTI